MNGTVIMSLNKLYSNKLLIVLGFIYLNSLHYFDYVNYDPTYGGWVTKTIVICLFMFIFIKKVKVKQPNETWKYALGFVTLPMLSFISCYFEHEQSILSSIWAYFPLFILPFTFLILYKYNVSTEDVVKLLTIFAVVRTGILLIEQFTYPQYLFAFRPEIELENGYIQPIEIRSGIYRFYISDTYLSMFLIFYWGAKMIDKFKLNYFLLFAWGVFGLWLDQTRQFMVVGYASFLIIVLLSKSKRRIFIFLSILIVFLVVFLNFDRFFGDLIEKTTTEVNSENIRLFSYNMYFNEYWGGVLSIIFGNGLPAPGSSYAQEITNMTQVMHLYRSDVGIVGFLNQYGIVSVVYFLWFYISYVRRNWKYFDMYIKMFLVATFLNLPLVVLFVNNYNWYMYWGFMLYLMSQSIKQNFRRRVF